MEINSLLIVVSCMIHEVVNCLVFERSTESSLRVTDNICKYVTASRLSWLPEFQKSCMSHMKATSMLRFKHQRPSCSAWTSTIDSCWDPPTKMLMKRTIHYTVYATTVTALKHLFQFQITRNAAVIPPEWAETHTSPFPEFMILFHTTKCFGEES